MKLSEITSVITDYTSNGSFADLRKKAKYVDKKEGYARVIRLTDENNKYSLDNAIYVNEKSYYFLSKSRLENNDIIVSNVGAAGTVFQCPNLCIPMTLGPNAILIRSNEKAINKYLYYLLYSEYGYKKLTSLIAGSAVPKFNKTDLKSMDVTIHNLSEQQHIVNTIGTVDDLIENYQKQNDILSKLGIIKINNYNNKYTSKSLSNIVKFEKGFEVGSSRYIEIAGIDLVPYLRVGDLLNQNNIFINENDSNKMASLDDILVAFDGAPGRNNFGLYGAFSSGIYNLKCDRKNKGLVFFEINSDFNQSVINNYSQGTTILHASKSINYLIYANISELEKEELNKYFYFILQNKKKIILLNKIKNNLLNKYF
ncbi:restriction endonuclease subunit S [Mycoplasma elephantis]|uniref:restriction endonuclease subunit S n=1 Tax=Mycoplasma elephantis TaxID=114882 RepID=UPI0004895FA6|nr:restriction endonuclease subunit S [Mycoplasma elephantis]